MKTRKWLLLMMVLSLLLTALPVSADPLAQEVDVVSTETATGNWYIVEFDAPSLSQYATSNATRFSRMSTNGKLDVHTSASRAYVADLKAAQTKFDAALTQMLPDALVAYNYQVALNAVAIKLPDSDMDMLMALKQMSGVARISPQRIYETQMDYSLPQINAEAMWAQLGGRADAGSGIKVAVIDSGIDNDHPLFDGTGWDYPTEGDWPKGYCEEASEFCNGKIIAARWYSPTVDINENEVFTPLDLRGHGTHTGGTAAGNITTATLGTETTQISGVAPGAWIMAYKGLFLNVAGERSTGSNIMLAAAIEDAIKDMPDVINCSWGSDQWELDDPLNSAYEAAVDAGIVVVFSTGNSGPDYNTAGSPYSPKFIEVGASTAERAFYNEVSVTAPTPVSPTIASVSGNEFNDIDASAIPSETVGPLPYIPCTLEGNPDMSLAGVTAGITQTEPYASGWIALIPRGAFNFTVKLDNALAHGADGVVMYTDAARTWKGGFTAGNRSIYSVMIANDLGLAMRDWWTMVTDTARIEIGYPVSAFESEAPDVIADFSSRGPSIQLGIQPDLVAPGVNILSGVANGQFASWGGTSMAAPHVVGAAALLLEQHPDWTPAQVKSALMSTANQTVFELDEVTIADIQTQGAGRIDLGKAGDPGLTFDVPIHSFGMVAKGTGEVAIITAENVSTVTETYTLQVAESVTDTGNITVSVSTMSFTLAAGESTQFSLSLDATMNALSQDVEGNVILSGTTHVAHIPYWARIVPTIDADVLLIDDDMSDLGNADYQAYYTQTLTTLDITYDVWNTTAITEPIGPGFPTREVLDMYDTVVYFSGDDFTFFAYDAFAGWGGGTPEELRAYLAGGGNMLVFGQDAAWGFDFAGMPMNGLFGAGYGSDDVYRDATIPQPSAAGVVPFLDGKQLDYTPAGDGAGNMSSVDALAYTPFVDTDNIPLFAIPSSFTPMIGEGFMGAAQSSDPTLERLTDPVASEWFKLASRTTFCSFGLEGINEDTGYFTRTALLGELFNYVNDDMVVTVEADDAVPLQSVTFSADISSTMGAEALQYRWDFGDGSPYTTTLSNTTTHTYTQAGMYQVRVEVTDQYMHTSVNEPLMLNIANTVFLPLVMRQ